MPSYIADTLSAFPTLAEPWIKTFAAIIAAAMMAFVPISNAMAERRRLNKTDAEKKENASTAIGNLPASPYVALYVDSAQADAVIFQIRQHREAMNDFADRLGRDLEGVTDAVDALRHQVKRFGEIAGEREPPEPKPNAKRPPSGR